MNTPAIAESVPNDRATALLEFMELVILHARSWGSELSNEQRFWLMDAIHNIPYYLCSGQEHYWDTTVWTVHEFDRRFADLDPPISLVSDLKAAIERASSGCSLIRR